MAELDIPLPEELTKTLALPACLDLQLPKPAPLSLTLPTGGSLKGIADITKGIPTDCTLSFNLMLQIGPIMASMECLLSVLKLIQPIAKVIGDLPAPPTPALIKDIADAIEGMKTCFEMIIPGGAMLGFVRDLLCLIMKILKCMIGQLRTVAGIMGGLALKIETAHAQGNGALAETLECAQENAMISAQHLFQTFEPLAALLGIAKPFMAIAQVDPIELPALGSPQDLESLNQTITALEGVADTLKLITDALGGCG